jgi:hypothetical protein
MAGYGIWTTYLQTSKSSSIEYNHVFCYVNPTELCRKLLAINERYHI